jgi:hypothetical protein
MKSKFNEMANGIAALKDKIARLEETLKNLRRQLDEWQQKANAAAAAASTTEIPCLPKKERRSEDLRPRPHIGRE